ncbi:MULTISPECIES: hypothetical protein [Bacillaceae]|nr:MULTISPECIES: hypothetical protein [Bacillaceae]
MKQVILILSIIFALQAGSFEDNYHAKQATIEPYNDLPYEH